MGRPLTSELGLPVTELSSNHPYTKRVKPLTLDFVSRVKEVKHCKLHLYNIIFDVIVLTNYNVCNINKILHNVNI